MEKFTDLSYYGDFKKTLDDMTNTKAPSKTNWMCVKIEPTEKSVKLHSTVYGGHGEGGLPELKGKLGADDIAMGIFRVLALDVKANLTSTRDKYIFFSWVGRNVGGVRRANVTGLKPSVIPMFMNRANTQLEWTEAGDIDHNAIANELLRIGGAHKPTQYDFGGDCKFDVPAHT